METADLEMVLAWRNLPEVRANMYTSHVISREEHESWFARVRADDTKQYFVYCEGDEPLGVVGFTDISPRHNTASWAFYSGVPGRRGLGTRMEILALDHAFETLGLEKLSCEVLSFNTAVIEMHKKFGFRVEGVFVKQFLTPNGYTDIYRLAMFKDDWLGERQAQWRAKLASWSTSG